MKLINVVLLIAFPSLLVAAEPLPNSFASVELEQAVEADFLVYNGQAVNKDILLKNYASAGVRVPDRQTKRATLNLLPSVPNAQVSFEVELHQGQIASISLYVYKASPKALRESLNKRFGPPSKKINFPARQDWCDAATLFEWDGGSSVLLFLEHDESSYVPTDDNPPQFIVLRSSRLYPFIDEEKKKVRESYDGDPPCFPIP